VGDFLQGMGNALAGHGRRHCGVSGETGSARRREPQTAHQRRRRRQSARWASRYAGDSVSPSSFRLCFRQARPSGYAQAAAEALLTTSLRPGSDGETRIRRSRSLSGRDSVRDARFTSSRRTPSLLVTDGTTWAFEVVDGKCRALPSLPITIQSDRQWRWWWRRP